MKYKLVIFQFNIDNFWLCLKNGIKKRKSGKDLIINDQRDLKDEILSFKISNIESLFRRN
jgi:hypothetical protein